MLKDLNTLETFSNSNYNFSFIHIPKTGGSSIQKIINNSTKKIKLYDHSSYQNWAKNKIIKDPNIKFTIVRNPYDRLVSAYFYLKDGGANNELDLGYKKKLDKFNSFENFIENLDYNLIYDILHFVPQHEYIVYQNNIIIDNIIHLENLNVEFENFSKKYNLENISVPFTNKSKHENFENYIEKYSIREKIYKLYEKDFNLLNYSY